MILIIIGIISSSALPQYRQYQYPVFQYQQRDRRETNQGVGGAEPQFKDITLSRSIRFGDGVVEGMKIQKYYVPSLTVWPDGRPVTQQAAPYLLVGVPE